MSGADDLVTRLRGLADVGNEASPLGETLGGYAAEAALKLLIDHWAETIRSDPAYPLDRLLKEVDDAMMQLLEFKVAARFPDVASPAGAGRR